MDVKEIQNSIYSELGIHLPEDDPLFQFILIEQAILAAHKEISDVAASDIDKLTNTASGLNQHIDKLGSTSNIVITAIKEIMDDVNRVSSESKQASLGSIQMLRKYMKDELPTIVNGIDTKPLSKKIEDEIIRTITLDTDKIKTAAQTQSKIIDDLMKATPSIISSVAKIKHSVESIEEYQSKNHNKLLWITGGSALAIGFMLGIILIRSIG
ncbi:MAG: hypothetical protein M1300_04540 [Epsilonproteobacteria bacterium]|nr:hypothetical protein [Campylobacterota bacterium]